jgi:hypothetical protein
VGRASNRKKAQREAGPSSWPPSQDSPAYAETQRQVLAAAVQLLARETKDREERATAARRLWSGGIDPIPAGAPRWPQPSLGDRFFAGLHLAQARKAPCLATAQIPDAAVITADPAHWNVAATALIRAIVYDDLGLDHPAVSRLLEVLAPVAEAELVYRKAANAAMYQIGTHWDEDEPEFPELDGPVFVLGTCALVDAVWAAVGEDPLTDVLGVLLPVLAAAVPGLDSQLVANALIGGFSMEYCCDQPGDHEVLGRLGPCSGDVLETLATAGAVPAADVLPVGLTILSALAQLCRSDSPSILQQTSAAPAAHAFPVSVKGVVVQDGKVLLPKMSGMSRSCGLGSERYSFSALP